MGDFFWGCVVLTSVWVYCYSTASKQDRACEVCRTYHNKNHTTLRHGLTNIRQQAEECKDLQLLCLFENGDDTGDYSAVWAELIARSATVPA